MCSRATLRDWFPGIEAFVSDFKSFLSSVEEIIEEARNGRMFVLVDAEERENEGDIVIPAQMCTPEAVNFMAKYGRGLVCLALTPERARQLNLRLMSSHNMSRLKTAFTVSIEAKEGISTGISAHDRAHTISVAIDPTKGADAIVSPGHVFPLVAREGGVLVRAGHTESAVDIARLAGLYPAGVICEVMNDDGSMARMPDLVRFAQLHGLKVATIADLIAYRRRYDRLVRRHSETTINSVYGGQFKLYVYVSTAEYAEHVVLVKGDVSGPEPVLVRMHAVHAFDDLLGTTSGRENIIGDSMRIIGREGRGVMVFIRSPTPTLITEMLEQGNNPESGQRELREYGVGAQILLDLGVRRMILLSNTPDRSIIGLDGYGLTVLGRRPISDPPAREA